MSVRVALFLCIASIMISLLMAVMRSHFEKTPTKPNKDQIMNAVTDQSVEANACRIVVPVTIKKGPPNSPKSLTTRLVRRAVKGDYEYFVDIRTQVSVLYCGLELTITHRHDHNGMITYYAEPTSIRDVDQMAELVRDHGWQSIPEWPEEPVLLAFELLPRVGQADSE